MMSNYGPVDRSANRRPASRWIALLLLLAAGGGGWLWFAPGARQRVAELATAIEPPAAPAPASLPRDTAMSQAAVPDPAPSPVAAPPLPPAAVVVTAPQVPPPPAAIPRVAAGMPPELPATPPRAAAAVPAPPAALPLAEKPTVLPPELPAAAPRAAAAVPTPPAVLPPTEKPTVLPPAPTPLHEPPQVVAQAAPQRTPAAADRAPSAAAPSVAALPPAQPPAAAAKAAPSAPTTPSFDIVRISPNGDAVLAGRAAPGSRVEIIDNGKPVAQAEADPQGQWVALPAAPLAPGGQQLSVVSIAPPAADAPKNSGEGVRSEGSAPVILMVPPRPARHPAPGMAAAEPPATAFALLAPSAGMPRLLQAPDAGSGKPPATAGLDIVDYNGHGAIRFAGRAPPHVTVRLYIDNRLAGETSADAFGRWMLVPLGMVAEGTHRVRIDQIGIHGEVVARIELPFERAALSAQDLLGGRVVVQPRQNLWRIARLAYGRGIQYTVIYQANREQIRDANLIYPGQIFAIPAVAP